MIRPSFGRPEPGVTYVDRPGAYGLLWDAAHTHLAMIRLNFGLFLPGGGLDPGEDPVDGLRRELREEIGYELTSALAVGEAEQYHRSEFYGAHFRKIGHFFRIEATPPPRPTFQAEHALEWMRPDRAARELTQEFQRWAIGLAGRV